MPGDSAAEFTLTHPKGELTLPETPAVDGPGGLGIARLLTDTGFVTLDPGFMNTASCSSKITFIDGEAGILRYRGYPIEDLAEKVTFLETSYLLIYGELPNDAELAAFSERINFHTLLHEAFQNFFAAFPRDAHPMAVLASGVNALSTFYEGSLDPFDDDDVDLATVRLIAKLPTIVAYSYKKSIGQPTLYPDNSLGYADNFLRMMFGVPSAPYEGDPEIAKILDMLFLLHADHEQNCSTSTVRLVGSSNA